jgi:hypothetical protein
VRPAHWVAVALLEADEVPGVLVHREIGEVGDLPPQAEVLQAGLPMCTQAVHQKELELVAWSAEVPCTVPLQQCTRAAEIS